ncbi:MAG: tetratricopeptide repeat protein [Bacteroidota bacterium]
MPVKILFSFLLFAGLSARAAFDFNSSCKVAYGHILSLRFEKGKELIAAEKKKNPQNSAVLLLENYMDFLTLFISEEKKQFDSLEKNRSLRLKILEKESKGNPWYLYAQAEINLQWAFARLKFSEYLAAATEINKAYDLLKENEKKFPAFIPGKKSFGLLHALIGTIPDEYKWVVEMVGITGTVRQGVGELKEVLEKSGEEYEFIADEALFLLSFIEHNLDNDEEELKQVSGLLDKKNISGSPLLVYTAASIAVHTGKGDKALQLLSKRPQGKDYFPFHYLDYLHGVALLNKLDTSASFYFSQYLTRFRGVNYIKSALQKLAWCEVLKGNTQAAKKYYALVIKSGNSLTDEDKQAQKEALSETLPHPILLKARLLFDGGYYTLSLKTLTEVKPSEVFTGPKEFLEYIYRLARIYHRSGNIPKAVKYYEETLKQGEKYPYYFAANSALHLGLIWESAGDKKKAAEYFKKVLSFKDHEYKNSIDQKAKAGLSRVQ